MGLDIPCRTLSIRTKVIIKTACVLLFISLVCLPLLYSQQEKVTVIVKSASIHAESNEHSHELDRAKMGDVLKLFEPWKGKKEWLYVIFSSKRWKGEITGFIKSSMVAKGGVIPEESIEQATAKAAEPKPEQNKELKEADKEEKNEKRGELPSLKDAFKSEIARTDEVAVQSKTAEEILESETAEPVTEEEAKVSENLKSERKDITIEPELIKEVEISAESEPIEKALPSARETEEAEAKIKAGDEFKSEEVPPPPVIEKPKIGTEAKLGTELKLETEPEFKPEAELESEPEPKVEPEPEIVPIKMEVILAESEILPIRDIVAPETLAGEPRAYAIIRTREEIPELKIRTEVVKGVAEAELEHIEVEPYEIKTEEPKPELKPEQEPEQEPESEAKTKTETETVEETTPEETTPEEIKEEESELPPIPVKPKEEQTIKEKKPILNEKKPEEDVQADVTKKERPEAGVEPRKEELEEQEIPPAQQRKPPPDELIKPKLPVSKNIGNLTIGIGYGPSYGGFGASLQLNTKSGFSIHAGAGYYPATYIYSDFNWLKNQILLSVGIKYYLPFKGEKTRPYLDLQYGGLTVEAVQVPTGYYEGVPILENIQKNLYGVSFLGGLELQFGRIGARGALGISYNTTEWEYWDRDYFLNGDFAIIVHF